MFGRTPEIHKSTKGETGKLAGEAMGLGGAGVVASAVLPEALGMGVDAFGVGGAIISVPFRRHKLKKLREQENPKYHVAKLGMFLRDIRAQAPEMDTHIATWQAGEYREIDQRIVESQRKERNAKWHTRIYTTIYGTGRAALLLAPHIPSADTLLANPIVQLKDAIVSTASTDPWVAGLAAGSVLVAYLGGRWNERLQRNLTAAYHRQYGAVNQAADIMRARSRETNKNPLEFGYELAKQLGALAGPLARESVSQAKRWWGGRRQSNPQA